MTGVRLGGDVVVVVSAEAEEVVEEGVVGAGVSMELVSLAGCRQLGVESLDHLGRQTLSLRHVKYAVLDEADQMLAACERSGTFIAVANDQAAGAPQLLGRRVALAGLDNMQRGNVYATAIERVRTRRVEVEETERIIARMTSQAGTTSGVPPARATATRPRLNARPSSSDVRVSLVKR